VAAADDPAADDDADVDAAPGEPVVRDGSGTYERGPDGVWRRRASGTVVAGAVDVRLGDLYDPPVVDVAGSAHRRVPRAWARRLPDHPLAWVFAHTEVGSRGPIDVPVPVWDERAAAVVGLVAPELHPVNLIGVETAAALSGVDASTIRAYVSRRRFPAPTTRVGGSPAWARAVVEDWSAARRPYRRRPPASDQGRN
jgi:predicted DNA-binding transcriptional regulator AlpA